MTLQIRPLCHALGAQISGVDIGKPLDDESYREIHAAFLKYCVLLFRGQPLTRKQHIEFSRRLGRVDNNDAAPASRLQDYPEILLVKAEPQQFSMLDAYSGKGVASEGLWHTDESCTQLPAMASLLRAVELPEVGGDTMFTNMYLAYETLSDGMKKLMEGLESIHKGGLRRIDNSTPERLAETRRHNTTVQPVVRVHPETGRKALFLQERTNELMGMTAEESRPLLQFLIAHAARPQFVYRHVWQKDDLVMWDNRCTMHIALGDYDRSQTRHAERTTLMGTPCGRAYYS